MVKMVENLQDNSHPVDVHVGSRVRLRRTLLGMSQEKLGQTLGLSFQQIQKYERGTNRMGSSRLYQLGRILGVPVSFFFEDMPPEAMDRSPSSGEKKLSDAIQQKLSTRETLELARAYYRIEDPDVRRRVFDLVKSLSGERREA